MTTRALANFGAGRLYGTRQDIANGTPLEFAVLQGCDFDFSFTTKPIYGTNQYALFVARGEGKLTMKAKSGVMSGQLISSIFFGIEPLYRNADGAKLRHLQHRPGRRLCRDWHSA